MNTKPSQTLRFLESHEVFTLDEFLDRVDPTVTERTRYANLRNAVRRGQAHRVKRGLYVSNIGVFRDRVPNVYLVAAKAARDATISHHSALEALGVAHSPSRLVRFTSDHRIRDFEVRGYRFRRVAPPPLSDPEASLDPFVERVRTGDAVVPVTTPARTMVDCLRDLGLAGGLEELLRSLGGFASVSADATADYCALLDSPTSYARAGWTLELFSDRWRIPQEGIERLRSALGRGTYRLAPSHPGPQQFISRWRLYVPDDLPLDEWVRG